MRIRWRRARKRSNSKITMRRRKKKTRAGSSAERPFTPPRKWKEQHAALLHLQDVLQRERDERARAIRVPLEHGGEDIVDMANTKSAQAMMLAAIRIQENELAEVQAALARMRDGTYGICEITGEPIPEARLKALPWTRYSHAAALKLLGR